MDEYLVYHSTQVTEAANRLVIYSLERCHLSLIFLLGAHQIR
jgi:hypothetical protein